MNTNVEKKLNILIKRYPELNECRDDIAETFEIIAHAYRNGGKLLVAGNGGSAADAEHIVGELMKVFVKKRALDENLRRRILEIDDEIGTELSNRLQGALPAISLDGHPAFFTACVNDGEPEMCFAQQIVGYAKEGDVFLGLSTSGNSKNIVYAAIAAKASDMKVIGLTGKENNRLEKYCDVCIKAPREETYMIQELHLPIYHTLCSMLEEEFF